MSEFSPRMSYTAGSVERAAGAVQTFRAKLAGTYTPQAPKHDGAAQVGCRDALE